MEGTSYPIGKLSIAWGAALLLAAGCTTGTLGTSSDLSRSYEAMPASYEEDSDAAVRERVRERLSGDNSIVLRKIEVSVSEGEVTLEGTVASRDESRRAMELVRGVSGVKGIFNKLKVIPTATAAP